MTKAQKTGQAYVSEVQTMQQDMDQWQYFGMRHDMAKERRDLIEPFKPKNVFKDDKRK